MESAVKIKYGMLEEHQKRPGEYGYNQTATHYFESESDFFEAWSDSLPSGLPQPAEDESGYVIHKRFGTLYVDDSGVPVACVQVDPCTPEEIAKHLPQRFDD